MNSNTKTQQLVNKYNSGDIKGAVKILSSFRIGITKEQKRILEIAKDCYSGAGLLYRQIGVDTNSVCNDASEILKNYIRNYYGTKRVEN